MKKLTILTVSALALGGSLVAAADPAIAALYTKTCAACHAGDGSGSTRMGKKSGARDYRDAAVQSSFSDSEGVAAIKNGVKKNGKEVMKAYAGKYTDAEMTGLVKYIRSFKK